MFQTLFLLAHVAGVGTVNDLSGGFIDEVNGDVLYLGAIENIVHSAVHIERQHGEGLCQIQFRGSRGHFELGEVRVRFDLRERIILRSNYFIQSWCPDQNYFAETAPGTAFFSEKGAMFLEGNWNILPELQNYPDLVGKWDVAVLPKCPNPASGDGRATISNGLCYATAANNKNLETVKDVLKFFGSEEGQRIQGESGAAIPAYQGLEQTWVGCFKDYPIDVQCFIDMFDYSIQSVNNASRPEWKSKVNDELLKIYSGQVELEAGLANMQSIVDAASAK